ncbi:MAG: hypothetical protein SynsKO_02580 [Synoicihabitans sp.]
MIMRLFYLACFVISLSLVSLLSAQEEFATSEHDEEEWEEDHEEVEVPEPSQREILNFLGQYLPEALPLLERVREEESFRDYQEVLERAAEIYIDYHVARQEGEQEEAQLILDMHRAELRLEQAAVAWHESESREERQQSLQQLNVAAAGLVDLEIKATRSELAFLEREARQLRQELDRMESARDALVEEIVREAIEE